MTKFLIRTSVCAFLVISTIQLFAQEDSKKAKVSFANGIGVTAPDSSFSVNFKFRLQSRAAYTTVSENDFSASEIEARVKRLRFKFDGFVFNPKLSYYIQLSLSRGDMDWVDNDNSAINSSPNIIRDAVVFYKANEHLTLSFGQTKLPGNRQRVNSSGDLQFADRSIVSATFNIDRDFGAQFVYQNNISKLNYAIKGALTTGEGRNSVVSDAGLAYTGRIEVLPLGKFSGNKGDYFEGDLEREPKPKISIGAVYHYNENAKRTAGTIGKDLYGSSDLKAFMADLLIKYNGFAFSSEFINRNTNNPITINSANDERVIYAGEGKMAQFSYLFKNNIELASRYAIITPFKSVEAKELQKEEIGLGLTKYLKKHRLKLQANIYHNKTEDLFLNKVVNKNWTAMCQIEIGI